MTKIVVLYYSIYGRPVVAKCIHHGAAPVESVESKFIPLGAEEVPAYFTESSRASDSLAASVSTSSSVALVSV